MVTGSATMGANYPFLFAQCTEILLARYLIGKYTVEIK